MSNELMTKELTSDELTSAPMADPPAIAEPDVEDMRAGLREALLQHANAHEQIEIQRARIREARISATDILIALESRGHASIVNGAYSAAVRTDDGVICFDVRPRNAGGEEAGITTVGPRDML